ncbi:hypothetical protein ACKFKG_18305 [Phormidesmis sp. 146-35]
MKRLAWKFCLISLIVLPLGISAIAFQVLKTPDSSSCETINDQANASQRLYCAKASVQQKTPGNLAAAIRLLGNLPSDLQPEGKQLVLQWSNELMGQAEIAFQAGEFENAIDLANSISRTSPTYDAAQRRISDWKQSSEKADEIVEAAIDQMAQREWSQALKTAGRLKLIVRAAWVTDRHIALVQQIKADREFRDPNRAIEPPRKSAPLNFKSDIAKAVAQKPTAKPTVKAPVLPVEPVSLVEATPPKALLTPVVSQNEAMMKHLVEETSSSSGLKEMSAETDLKEISAEADRVIPAFPQVPAPVKEGDRKN